MSEQEKDSSTIQVSLIPHDYRNEQFEDNMGFFQEVYPEIFNALDGYVPDRYQLCVNPDGTFNIFDLVGKGLVYHFVEGSEVIDQTRTMIDGMLTGVSIGGSLFDFHDVKEEDGVRTYDTINVDPIQKEMRRSLYNMGILNKDDLIESGRSVYPQFKSNYIPYLRVYGVGLGYHIQEVIRGKNVSFISIYEPNVDLFFTSMYTISWRLIFQYFSIKQRLFSSSQHHLDIVIGSAPEKTIERNKSFLKRSCRYLVLAQTRFVHFSKDESVRNLMRLEEKSDQGVLDELTNGWYEDQRAGLYYAARNLLRGNPVFTGRTVDQFLRVFIVGSGPSLNDCFEFIRENREHAIVIACGSALSSLLHHDIIPDFQMIQERDWHCGGVEDEFDGDVLGQVTLMKLNVVSPVLDRFFKDVLVFQKYNDPGSALLDPKSFAVTTHVNPTVTNAGVAVAAELGADEVYLFGVDYGASLTAKNAHSKGSLYEIANYYKDQDFDDSVDSFADLEVPSVFGGIARTNRGFNWSRGVTEDKIARYQNTRWINVGDGAAIKGTQGVHVEDLHNFSRKINKSRVMKDLRQCFSTEYDGKSIVGLFQTNVKYQVSDYLDMVLTFSSSSPKTAEELIMVITLMERAMSQHKVVGGTMGALQYYPGFLLSGGVQEFMMGLFGQALYVNDDRVIPELFEKAMAVLEVYRNRIVDDIEKLSVHLLEDEDLEIKSADSY